MIDAVVRDQYLALTNKSLQIELLCPDLSIECDQQKFHIIVDNLLSNAIKHSPSGGLIKVQASGINNTLSLDVIDFGSGIDAADREKIFEAFYQGRRAPQSHIRGTGLGLSIARQYALAHGGTIELAEQGEGTCFRVTLPLNHITATE
jgi:two-component system sensor histidine kinase GlrK